ncbi:pentatricopeptide repeat-containing protein At3g24000, mitochondrial-like [Carica papaya]|uniref:pentatricopeptide repeat-containing protein At3g24000, mitochondrial-like n=1 Tax=Carica papaya TaxID=3649 RepID=UPI000B8C9E53|nr:pentatricopeptide repeat-containing protein At3g24000, mitochondrial-like [Carica papaya]
MNFSLALSLQQFPTFPKKTVNKKDLKKDWNSIIKRQAKLKNDRAILSTYSQMESLSVLPDKALMPLIIKACARLNAIERGKRIHLNIRDTELIQDVRVRTALIDFYCKCGFLEDARDLFDEMQERDLVSWNAMISGYAGSEEYEEAVFLFMEMKNEGLKPNARTIVALLLACENMLDKRLGQEIHGYCLRNGLLDLDPHVGTALICFYLRYDVKISRLVFDLMVLRNIVSWNAMITGYFDVGDYFNALNLFIWMLRGGVQFDQVTVLVVVQTCSGFGCLNLGVQIHQISIKLGYIKDLFVINALLNMYGDLGHLQLSHAVFSSISTHDVAIWNSMISTNTEYGCHEEAASLFIRMRTEGIKENEITISILLSLCAEAVDGLKEGKCLHAHASKKGMAMDGSLGNAFLNMYSELNCVESAQKVFSLMSKVDVISYNTLILTLAQNKCILEAWELFQVMRESDTKPNAYTIISILPIFEDETFLHIGKSVHAFVIKHGIETNPSLDTALSDMYMNCGDDSSARYIFDACLDRDLISWNSLIASYIRNDKAKEALLLFNRMISEVEPNSTTIISILSSCTHLSNLPHGRCLHAYVLRRYSSFGYNLSLGNAFITMYARCGSMKNAVKIFKLLPKRNIISWNAIITGYCMHGRGEDAVFAFSQMLDDGFRPNRVTFLSLLSACSHSGMIEKGLEIFHSMVEEFKITPEVAHYGCVVDLLSRAGHLDEARKFTESMPIKPDASIWRALLSACRDHWDTKQAAAIFEKLAELEPRNAGNYVLLSNIYAGAGLWSEVGQIRAWLRANGLRKTPGVSWIVIRSQIHSFTAADRLHPFSEEIYAILSSLLSSIKEMGYVPNFHWLLHDEGS